MSKQLSGESPHDRMQRLLLADRNDLTNEELANVFWYTTDMLGASYKGWNTAGLMANALHYWVRQQHFKALPGGGDVYAKLTTVLCHYPKVASWLERESTAQHSEALEKRLDQTMAKARRLMGDIEQRGINRRLELISVVDNLAMYLDELFDWGCDLQAKRNEPLKPKRGGSRKTYDPQEDARLYRDWKASGLDRKTFAVQRGVNHSYLRKAIDRHRKRNAVRN